VNSNVRKFIEDGVSYFMGRDKNYRPVSVLRLTSLCNLDPLPTAEELIAVAFTLYEFTDTFMNIPGRIENRILIYDCADLGVMNFPYALVKASLGVMSNQYKQRPRAIFIVNAPTTFSTVYTVLSQLIDSSVTAKIKIVSENTSDELKELIHADQLEEKYGGSAPNKTGNYWPPSLQSDNFGAK